MTACCSAEEHTQLKRGPRAEWEARTLPLVGGDRPDNGLLEFADCAACFEASGGRRYTITRCIACRYCLAPVDGPPFCSTACETVHAKEKTTMHTFKFAPLLVLAIAVSSCLSWSDRQTPAGNRCGDMPIVPADKPDASPAQGFRRVRPISVLGCETFADCAWKLREKACSVGADGVVDVAYETDAGNAVSGQAILYGAASRK